MNLQKFLAATATCLIAAGALPVGADELNVPNPPLTGGTQIAAPGQQGNDALSERYLREIGASKSLKGMELFHFTDSQTRQLDNAPSLYSQHTPGVLILATEEGFGSGVVVSTNEVLTNYHVVEGNSEIQYFEYDAKLSSLEQLRAVPSKTAKVVAADPNRDLALLRVEGRKFGPHQVQSLGTLSDIRIADDVFAIGHPLGHLWSFTYGVVSALPSPYKWNYQDKSTHSANCIQTQTPINPGNSGGPLYDKLGRLIGINSMGIDSDGLNFAVRIDEIGSFLREARAGKFPPAAAKKEPEVKWSRIADHGMEGVRECWGADIDGDGRFDSWTIFVDADDVPDHLMFDTNGDGRGDLLCDLGAKTWLADTNYDYRWDSRGVDTDGDNWPDKYLPI